MKKKVCLALFLLFAIPSIGRLYAQSPKISYPNPNQVYLGSEPIAPLILVNTGGAVPAGAYGNVVIFAGTGKNGYVNGPRLKSQFNYPVGLIADAAGDIIVSDENNRIRKITLDGDVVLIAGDGTKVPMNGPDAVSSGFFNPEQMAIDASGNLFVTENFKNTIREIGPDGSVSNFAGQGNTGAAGTGSALNLYLPQGLVFDNVGNLYVSDSRHHKIVKISSDGKGIDFVGSTDASFGLADGIGTGARFKNPVAIARDAAGNFYVSDLLNYKIRKISPAGEVSTLAGSGIAGFSDGTGTAASFYNPYGICVDSYGNIYVADAGNNRIRKITPAGMVSTFAGDGTAAYKEGVGAGASFSGPLGVIIGQDGYLYISDAGNNLVRRAALFGYTIDKDLPLGLVFDYNTGTISGAPTVSSPPTSYTITAYNGFGSSSTIITIQVIIPLSFGPISAKLVCDADFDPGAFGGSGAVLNYTSSNTAVATIVGDKIHIVSGGTAIITVTDGVTFKWQILTVTAQFTSTHVTIVNNYGDANNGSSISFKANVSNAPLAFKYQWMVNGVNEGPNSPEFTNADYIFKDGDVVSCIIVLIGNCSNEIVSNLITVFKFNVPNVFTPNGDEINDRWLIKNISDFPTCTVCIYDRSGSLVYRSKGYTTPWDGTFKGRPLPVGTYYYVIDLGLGGHNFSGSVTIVR